MAYGVKYQIYFRELHTDELWRTDILERDYSGSATEIVGSGTPLIREWRPENDNDYDWIRPSVCTVSMISQTDMQFIEFFTSDNRKYQIKVYRDSMLLWAGWIIPDTYKEPYEYANYEVSISATDGLLSLKDVQWEATKSKEPKYTNIQHFLFAIQGCLNKLDLPEVHLWDATYIYEQNFNQTDSDSPLTQIYFNTKVFYDEYGVPSTCYDVLLNILKVCGSQLWMENGYWNIVPQNARKTTYVRRKFEWSYSNYYKFTTVSTTETYDPSKSYTNISTPLVNTSLTDYIHLYATPDLSFRPGWQKCFIKHEYGYHSNLLESNLPYFSSDFDGGIDDDGRVINGTHYDMSEMWRDDYIMYNLGSFQKQDDERLRIHFGGHGGKTASAELNVPIFIWLDTTSGNYVLDSDGHWHKKSINFNYNSRDHALWDMSWDSMAELEPLITDELPADGTIYIKLLAIKGVYVPNDNYEFYYYLNEFKIELLSPIIVYENKLVEVGINTENTYVPETIEVLMGDCDLTEQRTLYKWDSNGNVESEIVTIMQDAILNVNQLYKGILYRYSGPGGTYYDNYELTSLWTIKGKNQYNKLINLLADEIAVNHIDPQWIIDANVYGNLDYGSIISVDAKKYMILRASHDPYNKEWEVELFEISDTEQGFLKLRSGGYIKLRGGGKIKRQ